MSPILNYSYQVFWSEGDEGYIAISPEFPNVSGFGESEVEALSELKEALDLAVETYKEEGWPLPEPRLLPDYSGQFRLRLPKSLHAQLAHQAEVEGTSLNALAIQYLSQGLGYERGKADMQSVALQAFRETFAGIVDAIAFRYNHADTQFGTALFTPKGQIHPEPEAYDAFPKTPSPTTIFSVKAGPRWQG